MVKRSRAQRFSVPTDPHDFLEMESSRGAWEETEKEAVSGLRWGKRKTFLLAWVRRQMLKQL